MARRKYRFRDRASAEEAFKRVDEQCFVLGRLVADLQSTDDHFGYVRSAVGSYGLIVRENGAGIFEGALIFDPGGQKPHATPIVDLAAEMQEWHRLAQIGGKAALDLAILGERAMREAKKAREDAEARERGYHVTKGFDRNGNEITMTVPIDEDPTDEEREMIAARRKSQRKESL